MKLLIFGKFFQTLGSRLTHITFNGVAKQRYLSRVKNDLKDIITDLNKNQLPQSYLRCNVCLTCIVNMYCEYGFVYQVLNKPLIAPIVYACLGRFLIFQVCRILGTNRFIIPICQLYESSCIVFFRMYVSLCSVKDV